MKVTVLEPCGFCAGVDRAINLAIKTKNENPQNKVVILGMLVHNQDALKSLKKQGISTIFKENSSLEELAKLVKAPSIVILTAHGHDKKIEKILKENGNEIVDATCPFVQNSFKEIENEINEGSNVFYIGVKNHPEANAALSLSDKIYFIDSKNPVIPEHLCGKHVVISQTTLAKDEVSEIINNIKTIYPETKVIEGICNASTERQRAIKTVPNDVDGIIVVGGANSNNSKTLFSIAKDLYPNKKVLLIENASQIKEKDLIGLNHIAISSGASTPRETIEEIKSKLLN